MKYILLLVTLLTLGFCTGRVFAAYPSQNGSVNDFAQVISPQTVMKVTQASDEYTAKTGHHIVIVTVQTTNPETIEDYTTHLAAVWNISDGVLLVTAVRDRHIHIYVSQNLRADLTTVQLNHILVDDIQPAFHTGDYDQGIEKGVSAIIAASNHQVPKSTTEVPLHAGIVLFFVIFGIIAFMVIFASIKPVTRFK